MLRIPHSSPTVRRSLHIRKTVRNPGSRSRAHRKAAGTMVSFKE
nr:MAG TPA: hypothetical protein [Caudoviricetes sp.]